MIDALYGGQWGSGYWVGGLVMRCVSDAWINFLVAWLVYRWVRGGCVRFWDVKPVSPRK